MDAFLATATEPTTLLILAVILCAVIVRAAFGFGDVLVSVPILSLFVSPKMVIPLMGLVGATNALLILLRERKAVHWRPVRYLLMASFVGVPLGVWLLKWLPESTINLALGLMLVAFCGWSLFGRKSVRLRSALWAWPFGFGAGVMGGAVTATGPPIVLYSATQGWTPEESRATMQGFFFPNSIFILSSHWWADMWTTEVVHTYVLTLPVCLFALPLGSALAMRMSRTLFEKLTMMVLFSAGLLLIWV
jgi:uncharacterized membrane protein YfcA